MAGINKICVSCGLKRCPTPLVATITFRSGKCDICKEVKSITSERHYPRSAGDLIGKRFGLLCISEEGAELKNPYRGTTRTMRCTCDCGQEVSVALEKLNSLSATDCGCRTKFTPRHSSVEHGMSGSRQYKIWAAMKHRATNKSSPGAKDYVLRGITLCERWEKFENFWEDMKEGYSDKLTLDRKENNKGYYKENCRWATMKEQANNKRSSNEVRKDREKIRNNQ